MVPMMKLTGLLDLPATVTTTLPELAPAGTVAMILVALQLVAEAAVPLNVTVLVPCGVPKFVPVIVTEDPTGPTSGDILIIVGPGGPVEALNAAMSAIQSNPEGARVQVAAMAPAEL